MKNPFDINEDVDEDWDSNPDESSDQTYDFVINTYRMLFQKTREALNYIKPLNKRLLIEAEKRLIVEVLMGEQREISDIEKELEKDLTGVKRTWGIVYDKTLEGKISRVEKVLLEIPSKDFDKISDYNCIMIGSYASYLRRIAKHAWDIENRI